MGGWSARLGRAAKAAGGAGLALGALTRPTPASGNTAILLGISQMLVQLSARMGQLGAQAGPAAGTVMGTSGSIILRQNSLTSMQSLQWK